MGYKTRKLRLKVLDVRARRLRWPPDGESQLKYLYCVLRLGGLHHRSPTFPPVGIAGVPSRSTTGSFPTSTSSVDIPSISSNGSVREAEWEVRADWFSASSSDEAAIKEIGGGVYCDLAAAGIDVPVVEFKDVSLCELRVPLTAFNSEEGEFWWGGEEVSSSNGVGGHVVEFRLAFSNSKPYDAVGENGVGAHENGIAELYTNGTVSEMSTAPGTPEVDRPESTELDGESVVDKLELTISNDDAGCVTSTPAATDPMFDEFGHRVSPTNQRRYTALKSLSAVQSRVMEKEWSRHEQEWSESRRKRRQRLLWDGPEREGNEMHEASNPEAPTPALQCNDTKVESFVISNDVRSIDGSVINGDEAIESTNEDATGSVVESNTDTTVIDSSTSIIDCEEWDEDETVPQEQVNASSPPQHCQKRLVWGGPIPEKLRNRLYCRLSGGGKLRRAAPPSGSYAACHQEFDKLLAEKARAEKERVVFHIVPRSPEIVESDENVPPPPPAPKDCEGAVSAENGGSGGWLSVDHELECVDMGRLSAADAFAVAREIDADVDRVFPDCRTKVNSEEGQKALRRVLRAYAVRNPAVAYCQGLNFIVGLLLEVVSEETAFWVLAGLVEGSYAGTYSRSMIRARADIAALAQLLREELPLLSKHADDLGLPLELVGTPWILVHFINSFPPATALRCLEAAMIEGAAASMCIALAFLRMHEHIFLQTRDARTLAMSMAASQAGMYDSQLLMDHGARELAKLSRRVRLCRNMHEERLVTEALCPSPKSSTKALAVLLSGKGGALFSWLERGVVGAATALFSEAGLLERDTQDYDDQDDYASFGIWSQ